jgi:hypothetical protein
MTVNQSLSEVDAFGSGLNEDAVNGQVFALTASGTNGEDVNPVPTIFSRLKEDSNWADRLHPFGDWAVVGVHSASSFVCSDLKCFSAALGGASCEIGRS